MKPICKHITHHTPLSLPLEHIKIDIFCSNSTSMLISVHFKESVNCCIILSEARLCRNNRWHIVLQVYVVFHHFQYRVFAHNRCFHFRFCSSAIAIKIGVFLERKSMINNYLVLILTNIFYWYLRLLGEFDPRSVNSPVPCLLPTCSLFSN